MFIMKAGVYQDSLGKGSCSCSHRIDRLEDKVDELEKAANKAQSEQHETLSLMSKYSYWATTDDEVAKMQAIMDSVTKSLTKEQIAELETVIDWAVSEGILDEAYSNNEGA